jgi:hypothetical protein
MYVRYRERENKTRKKTGRRKTERRIIRKGEERRQKTKKREDKIRKPIFCIKMVIGQLMLINCDKM